ncbi:MAG: hypothetical protein WAO56_01845 [Miniphocaeibacter sp.]|uniref:rRNA biogenesis protein rrp5 n=1 Tax=Miniphocaeibacter sp. TaxID=3100973 RepID=UPI003BAF6C22
MSKMNELSQTLDELKNVAASILSITDTLTDLFSGAGSLSEEVNESSSPPIENKKLLTLESVRGVLAEKSRSGYTNEIKALIEKYGAAVLSEVDPKNYQNLLDEVKVLGSE